MLPDAFSNHLGTSITKLTAGTKAFAAPLDVLRVFYAQNRTYLRPA